MFVLWQSSRSGSLAWQTGTTFDRGHAGVVHVSNATSVCFLSLLFFFYYLFLVISNSISLCGTGLRRCKFPAEKLHFYFAARRRINIYDGRNATVRRDAMRCVIVNDCCLYNFESAYVQCKFSVAFSTVCFACLSATMLNDAIGSMTFCQIFITLQDRKVF